MSQTGKVLNTLPSDQPETTYDAYQIEKPKTSCRNVFFIRDCDRALSSIPLAQPLLTDNLVQDSEIDTDSAYSENLQS